MELKSPVILAPMAGVSDMPFRLLCSRFGASMCCMEMISAKAIKYNSKKTDKLMETDPEESVTSLQLFGSDPDIMGEIAARIEERPFDIFDINMGCPVPKVVNNHEGSALMKDPILAGRIVESMAKAVKKPVTVKIRKGFDETSINAPEIAHIAQESGAAAVTVHGRTREDYYSGKADWDIIGEVVSRVSIPVIGNGDVTDGKSAKALMDKSGCMAVAIGRAAQGNPWIFREVNHYLETGEVLERPSLDEIKKMIMEHARMLETHKGEYIASREMRRHAPWYLAGCKGAASFRRSICQIDSMEDLQEILHSIQ